MVKSLNFHNSSFALRYFFLCIWQGYNVTHPLFVCKLVGYVRGRDYDVGIICYHIWKNVYSVNEYIFLF
jgi:hypothetical protein